MQPCSDSHTEPHNPLIVGRRRMCAGPLWLGPTPSLLFMISILSMLSCLSDDSLREAFYFQQTLTSEFFHREPLTRLLCYVLHKCVPNMNPNRFLFLGLTINQIKKSVIFFYTFKFRFGFLHIYRGATKQWIHNKLNMYLFCVVLACHIKIFMATGMNILPRFWKLTILCLCSSPLLCAGTASSWPLGILSFARSHGSTCLTTACTLQILQGKLCQKQQQSLFIFSFLMQDVVIMISRRVHSLKLCNQPATRGEISVSRCSIVRSAATVTVTPRGWFPLLQTVWQFKQTACTPSRVGVASF